MMRFLLIIISGFIVQGCAITLYSANLFKLENPVDRSPSYNDYFSSITVSDNRILSASIGDELFVMNRYINIVGEVVNIIPPTQRRFPNGAKWTGTHIFHDNNFGNFIVYSSPSFYDGYYGVILDENEHVATKLPFIQLEGAQMERRWKVKGSGIFFSVPGTNIDSWALRYGGSTDGQYIFEIVNKHESKNTEVLQTIRIDSAKFRKGFVIRNVLIKGMNTDEYGVIQYTIKDVLKKSKA